jgi:hypothetical protein
MDRVLPREPMRRHPRVDVAEDGDVGACVVDNVGLATRVFLRSRTVTRSFTGSPWAMRTTCQCSGVTCFRRVAAMSRAFGQQPYFERNASSVALSDAPVGGRPASVWNATSASLIASSEVISGACGDYFRWCSLVRRPLGVSAGSRAPTWRKTECCRLTRSSWTTVSSTLDEVLAGGGDYLDDEERGRLHASIERGVADVRAGRTADGREVIARLRARSASR